MRQSEETGVMAMHCTCSRERPGSNHGRDYPDVSRWFSQFLQAEILFQTTTAYTQVFFAIRHAPVS